MNEIQRILRQIHRAAGIDPDGPRLVPMLARLSPEQTQRELRRAIDVATRDAMLRRAIGCAGAMSHAPLAPAAKALHAFLEFKLPGVVELGEALPEEGGRTWETVELLSAQHAEDIELEIGHCTDPDIRDRLGYFVELSVYHQKNPETDRSFHSRMNVHPTRGDIVRMRDFLDFLLRQPDE